MQATGKFAAHACNRFEVGGPLTSLEDKQGSIQKYSKLSLTMLHLIGGNACLQFKEQTNTRPHLTSHCD